MTHFIRAAVAALALVAALPAAAQEPVFTAQAFKAHVDFLASDLLEGRGTGQRGHEIAALYVASQFEGMGLRPGGPNGAWYQPVVLHESAFGPDGARITVSGPDGAMTWENGTEVVLFPNALMTDEAFEAPAVFVGFGIDAPEHGFADYEGLDVRGKVVVALSGSPRGLPSEIGAHLGGSVKYRMARKHGAAGLIVVRTLASESARSFEKVRATATVPRMTWVQADGTPFMETPDVRQVGTFNAVSAKALFAGSARTHAQILKAADRTRAKVKGFPLKTTVRLERQSTHRTIVSPNVVALLPGGDPVLKDEYVVVMGHLDHLGIRPELEGDAIYNGAMDNATGIAAIIETARALAKAPTPPRRSILFMAVTAEEKGLLGAEYFAANPLVPLEKVAGVVNMDMPILTFDFGDVVAFGAESSTLGQLARQAAADVGVALTRDPSPEQGYFTRSDHYELVKKGVPAIYLDVGFRDAAGGSSGEAATREFMQKHYHEVSDAPDLPFVWSAGAKFTRMNWSLVSAIANADEPGRWYEGDFFGATFAPDAPKARR